MGTTRQSPAKALPFLYSKMNVSHLHENGKLLTDEQILLVKNKLKEEVDGRISRSLVKEKAAIDVPITWDIVKMKGRWFAVYLGDSRPDGDPLKGQKGKAAKGGISRFRVMQDLDSGKLYGLKVRDLNEDLAVENLRKAEYESEKEILSLVKKMIPDTVTGFPTFGKEGAPGQQNMPTDLEQGFEFTDVVNKFQINPVRAWDAVIQIFEEIRFLHEELGILHNDIKLENAMFDIARMLSRLIDYGLADKIDDTGQVVGNAKGTLACLAPEIKAALDDASIPAIYNYKTDAYSAGVLLEDVAQRLWLINNPQVQALINDLKLTNPDERIKVDSTSIARLKNIRASLVAENPIRIGFLNIQDFENTNAEQRRAMISELKQLNEIILVSSGEVDVADSRLITIRRELESNHIILRDKVLLDPSADELHAELKGIEQNEKVLVQGGRLIFNEAMDMQNQPVYQSPLGMSQLTIAVRDVLKTKFYDYYIERKNELMFQNNLEKLKRNIGQVLERLADIGADDDDEDRKYINNILKQIEENPEKFRDPAHPIFEELQVNTQLEAHDSLKSEIERVTYCENIIYHYWNVLNDPSFRKNITTPEELTEKLEGRLKEMTTSLKKYDKDQSVFYDDFLELQKKALKKLTLDVGYDPNEQFTSEALLLQLRVADLIESVTEDARHSSTAKELLSECQEIVEKFNQLIGDYKEDNESFMASFHPRLASIKIEFDDLIEATLQQEKYRVQNTERPGMGFFKGESSFLRNLRSALPESKEARKIQTDLRDPDLKNQQILDKISFEKPAEALKRKF